MKTTVIFRNSERKLAKMQKFCKSSSFLLDFRKTTQNVLSSTNICFDDRIGSK